MTWRIDKESVIGMQQQLSSLIGCPGREEPGARFVLDRISRAAEKAGVKWQHKKPIYGGTDGTAIARTRSGCPTGVVAVPCRYIHGPAALLKVEDLLDTIRLVAEFCITENPAGGSAGGPR